MIITSGPGYAKPEKAWLGNKDSNLDWMIQSHLCYRYTIPQRERGVFYARQ